MKNKGTHFLVQGAAIAAVYVVLTLVFAPLSFGEVQIRFSEALTVLPFFTPAAIPVQCPLHLRIGLCTEITTHLHLPHHRRQCGK